ncbi:acyl carrier protein [Methanogenium organophilum]|uniref:Acyl carrier protein n=1 Tax=Methanogenium organophilum TaxID=2199 RepID=A0A9X9T7L0_METOG|nr:acyl carrier protein [Methanogenium organophilum]WAI01209.1 acyl carrier protein [Methanogenium organophilum]
MTNEPEYMIKKIFCNVMGVEESYVNDDTAYNSFDKWDSLKHLQLVSEYEDQFDLEFQMDDIIAMENFGLIKETIAKYLAE